MLLASSIAFAAVCLIAAVFAHVRARRLAEALVLEKARHKQTESLLVSVRRQIQDIESEARVRREAASVPAARTVPDAAAASSEEAFDPFGTFGFQPTQFVRRPTNAS